MQRPGCWPLWHMSWRRPTHPTCGMGRTNASKPSPGPWPPKSGRPTRPFTKPQSSSHGCPVLRKARVKSLQSTLQGGPTSPLESGASRASARRGPSRAQASHGATCTGPGAYPRHGPRLPLCRSRARGAPQRPTQRRGYARPHRADAQRLDKAERVVPKRQGPIACVSGAGAQQVAQRAVTPPVSWAMHAKLIPAYYLDRVAGTRSVSDGEPLHALAARLRTPLCAPGGVLRALSPGVPDHLQAAARRLAAGFQRSSSHGEGRNGSLSLRSHQRRGLDLPRQRQGFTAMHNFFLTRPDGTTAAERYFGQKPRSMFAAILASVELAPAPLSPPRKV